MFLKNVKMSSAVNPPNKDTVTTKEFNSLKKAQIIPKQNAGSIRKNGILLKIFIG